MTNEMFEAAKAVIQRSTGPMTAKQVRDAVGGRGNTFSADLRKGLQGHAQISVWKCGNSYAFASRPSGAYVEEAFLRAIEERPLTIAKAAKVVEVPYVSEERFRKEVKAVLSRPVVTDKLFQFPASRQSVIYFSRVWMAKQGGAGTVDEENPLASVIRAVVERLQSGPGNYVRVDHLRRAPELRAELDKAVIRLARAGKLVLGRYEGPRPVPEDEEWAYIPGEGRDLFISVALPRDEGASS